MLQWKSLVGVSSRHILNLQRHIFKLPVAVFGNKVCAAHAWLRIRQSWTAMEQDEGAVYVVLSRPESLAVDWLQVRTLLSLKDGYAQELLM